MRVRLEGHRRFHRRAGKTFRVLGRDRAPAGEVAIDGAQFQAQHRRLDLVETRIHADLDVHERLGGAVVAQPADMIMQIVTVGGNHSTVAVSAQHLGRIETERTGVADRTGDLAAPACPIRLRAVFQHRELTVLGNLHDRVHVAGMAEDVHRQDRLGFRAEPFDDAVRIDAESVRPDIDEHRRGADHAHRLGTGEEGPRRGDDLVARADTQRAQR